MKTKAKLFLVGKGSDNPNCLSSSECPVSYYGMSDGNVWRINTFTAWAPKGKSEALFIISHLTTFFYDYDNAELHLILDNKHKFLVEKAIVDRNFWPAHQIAYSREVKTFLEAEVLLNKLFAEKERNGFKHKL